MDDYQTFIHQSRYARWLDKEKRRETWAETVDRYLEFMQGHLLKSHNYKIPIKLYVNLRSAILELEVMPSMRALMSAGLALERENIAGFNCAYLAVDDPRAFDEALYILLCGTGVGFSVERDYTSKLPIIPPQVACDLVIKVGDSKRGWAEAYREVLDALWMGYVPTWDMSAVRPSGSRLKTFGGRASGPEPLDRLFRFTVQTFKAATGRKLNSIECHDLMCMVADTVVVGGVRRAAMISLSTLYDDRMRTAPVWVLNNSSIAACFFACFRSSGSSSSGSPSVCRRCTISASANFTARS